MGLWRDIKGLRNLTRDDWKQVGQSAYQGLRDGNRAVGRGMWDAATATAHIGGGLAKGLVNLGDYGTRYIGGVIPAIKTVTGVDRNAWSRHNARMDSLRDTLHGGIDKFTDKVTELNDIVQDYHKYENPNNPALKASQVLGGVGFAAGMSPVMIHSGATRLFTPVRSTGVLGKLAPWAKSPVVDGLANVVSMGVPVIDYTTGLTHINPGDSKFTQTVKRNAGRAVQVGAALLSPGAGLNYLYRTVPAMASPVRESRINAALNVLPNYAPQRGIIPTAIKYRDAVAQYAKGNQQVLDTMMPYVFNGATSADKMQRMREVLDKTSYNKYLTLSGLQPSMANPVGASVGEANRAISRNMRRPRFQTALDGKTGETLRLNGALGKYTSDDAWEFGRRAYNADKVGRAVSENPRFRAEVLDDNIQRKRGYSPELRDRIYALRQNMFKKWYPASGGYAGPRGTLYDYAGTN